MHVGRRRISTREHINARASVHDAGPQHEALLENLTASEHLYLYARIKGVPESRIAGVVDASLQQMDLVQYRNKLAGTLSGGNKRKLSLAIALIGGPAMLFLDEPSTGV